jgi:hypothetical protein
MTTRDNMSAMIEGLQRKHGLLAAYLEAADNHKRVVIAETPKQVFAAPQLPEVVPPTSPFVLRRANLARIWPGTWISENEEPSGTAPSHSRIYSPQVEMVLRAAVWFQLARLTACMDGAARRLEAATAAVQRQRKFAVFVVACLVVASFAGTYFDDGITAVLAQYPAHSDELPSELAGASRQIDSQEALSRNASEEAEQRQAMEGTVTELRQSLQQEREKTAALEQQAKAARQKQEAERRIAELQTGARRDQTHGPQPLSSVRHHRARSRCFWFLFQNQCF